MTRPIFTLYAAIALLLMSCAAPAPQEKPAEAAKTKTIVRQDPNETGKQPPKEPILRIETGMHTATIRRIGVDAKNRYLATGSEDKTIRIWELSTGKLLNILRPPISEGEEGKIQAIAMSPDGNTVAAGGWTGYEWEKKIAIYLFDGSTGTMKKRITGLPNVIKHLSYSKDGQFLAAALGSDGIRVFRASDGMLTGEEKQYGDSSYGADFSHDSRLITTCYDSFIRLYELKSDGSLKLLAKRISPGGKRPHQAVFSSDGTKIAVGFDDSAKVDVLSGQDLSYIFSPSVVGLDNGDLPFVAWSDDGKRLFAGGGYNKDEQRLILAWSDAGKGNFQELPGASNRIMHILPLKNDGIVFGAASPAFGVISASGERTLFKSAEIADHRGMNKEGFRLSPDGKTVSFWYEEGGKSPAVFGTDSGTLTPDGDASTLFSPDTSSLNITDWKNNTDPKLNGNTLKLKQYEISRSLAVSPLKNGFLIGASWYLRFFDQNGTEQWNVPAPGEAWGVNIAKNGKLATAAFADGTIRWYRLSDGKELLAFFPHNDRKRWVMWTSSGYYTASAGGEELIGWHINNGKNHAADFYTVSRFRDTYYRPDITEKILVTLDEKQAIRLANEESGRRQQEVAIQQILPPKVIILSPQDGTELSNPEITVAYQADTPSDAPITEVKVLIDGRPLSDAKSIVRHRETAQAKNEIRVKVPEKDCKVSVIAYNRHAASQESGVSLKWKGRTPAPDENILKPRLYILSVGVSNYQDTGLRLKFAAKDAKDFAQVLEKQKGKHYGDVVTLLKQDATRADVLEGFEWIEKHATKQDTAMIFISGHGMNDSYGSYYFLASDANPDKIKSTGVLYSDIKNTMSNLPSKVLLFIDTCHAGNVMGEGRKADVTRIVNELSSAENGIVVFASSTGKQSSLENTQWGNGAFTKALVEGLDGGADLLKKGKITISLLNAFVYDRVTEMTGGKQTPVNNTPKSTEDFTIAVK